MLANRAGLQPNIDTTTLLWLQGYRNELANSLCGMLISAGNASELAACAQDIAFVKGKLDLITEILTLAKIDTNILSTDEVN